MVLVSSKVERPNKAPEQWPPPHTPRRSAVARVRRQREARDQQQQPQDTCASRPPSATREDHQTNDSAGPSSLPPSAASRKEEEGDHAKDRPRPRLWDPDLVLKQKTEFDANFHSMGKRIHKFPPGLLHLRNNYCSPVHIPMGPYFKDDGGSSSMISSDDDLVRLTTMVKDVATHHFQSDTTIFSSFDEMYAAFCSTVGDVRVFYEHGSSYNDDTIKLDMLRDGCFLLQYMDMCTTTSRDKMPPSLVCYFESNQVMIDRDIMLLENQLPWVVIETLRSYRKIEQSVAVEGFVEKMARTLQVRKGKDDVPLALDGTYTPPHLLGLLWFYKTRRSHQQTASDDDSQQNERSFSLMVNSCCYMSTCGLPLLSDDDHARITTVSKTTSAIELAEIGIKITASKTTNFTDMGINKGLFCTEISLPPLLLDETRLSWLVNMAAFELCIAGTLGDGDQKHAICSYLFVLAMLMDREDDVHRLRSKGLVQGELSNKEMLHFFKLIVKHISGGPRYMDLMGEIEEYKLKRWMWIKVHKFIYKNYKTIAAVLSIIGVLVGIFKELFSLKRH